MVEKLQRLKHAALQKEIIDKEVMYLKKKIYIYLLRPLGIQPNRFKLVCVYFQEMVQQ